MLSLGYKRYAIQAGDWGSAVLRYMAAMYPRNVAAVHLNFSPSPPPLLSPPLINLALRLVPTKVASLCSALTPTFVSNSISYLREYPRRLDRQSYTQEPTFMTLLSHLIIGSPAPLSKQDRAKVQTAIDFMTTGSAYAAMQGTRPSTLGLVLQSDPGALLAWVGEKLLQWTDEE
jgi:pimeloyl-ACP methyl ester carboxylesterase